MVQELPSQELRALKDRIVARLGDPDATACVCGPDMENDIRLPGSTARERVSLLERVLEGMVAEGILKHCADPSDSRDYLPPHQITYELVR